MTTANRLREKKVFNDWGLVLAGEGIVSWRTPQPARASGWNLLVKGRRLDPTDIDGSRRIAHWIGINDPLPALREAAAETGCARWARSPFGRHAWIPAVALERHGIKAKVVVEVEAA